MILQYSIEKGFSSIGIDTDQVNSTLKGYAKLDVTALDIKDNNSDNIDSRKFDNMIEMLQTGKKEQHFIIDNGASTFIPLCAYIKENDVFSILGEKYQLYVHTVITGGQAITDTVNGLHSLISNFDLPIVVWLNRYFGEIDQDGKDFEKFKIYRENKDKIASIIKIPLKNKQTFGRDLEELFSRRQTFAEALADESLPLMTRQRLRIWWGEVCVEMDKAQLI